MGLFDAVEELVGAAANVALTPLDLVRDMTDLGDGYFLDRTGRRWRRVGDHLERAVDEVFE